MELATQDPAYEDVASKFWEHFIYIAHAMNHLGHDGMGLWDAKDGFFYDVLKLPDGGYFPVKIRSMVGLIPLFAVETLEPGLMQRLPGFKRRMDWFIENRPDLTANVASMQTSGMGERRLLSIVDAGQLRRMLHIMLDENEFLSPHGIRALSLHHRDHPFSIAFDGKEHRVDYEPGESTTGLFGGNSNWRGPVWFPVNYLLIESLQKFHHYFGDDFKVEFPSGSGNRLTLSEVAAEISRRLTGIFLRDEHGNRPVNGGMNGSHQSSTPIPTGAISFSSTNISTATPAKASEPATRPAGPPWSPSSCNRAPALRSRRSAAKLTESQVGRLSFV